MKLSIPEKIKSSIDTVEAVYLETAKANAGEQSPAFASSMVSLKHIAAVDFVDIHNNTFENCTHIQYRVVYKNNTTEIFKFPNKQSSVYRSGINTGAHVCVRHKISKLYADTDESRRECLIEIDKKISDCCVFSDSPVGEKNLIYYSVYFDNGYTDLLELSISSILKHSKINFDVLIITDEPTKELILKLPFCKSIEPKFLITKTPSDGVEASQSKTLIYDYTSINDYKNILFLDCDIVCIKDVNLLFNLNYIPGNIYAAKPLNLDYGAHSGVWHGFPFLGDEIVKEMRLAKQMPFNAGQFFFVNTPRMKQHFSNINWFMENWSGEYFFEQAFMCYYFGKAYCIGSDLLDNHVTLINTTNDMKYVLDKDTHLIHFIAPPLQAKSKIEFINKYLKEHFTFWGKIKNLFKKTLIYAIFKKIQSLFHTHTKNRRNDY